MRLFIGSFFDPAFSGALAGIAGGAEGRGGAARWVKPELFHLTYLFLGEAGGPGPAVSAMDEALDGVKAFGIASGELGAFPSLSSPRVLWLGIAEGAELLQDVAARLQARLPEYRGEPFVPHVTLARVKGVLPRNCLERAAGLAAGIHAVSTVRSVVLVESVLSRGGPAYRQVYTKQLL